MAIGVLAKILPWHDPVVEEARGRFHGQYIGIVRDRNDPQKTGRIRVYCPAVFGDEQGEDSWLDWCLPAGAGLNVPPLNAPVWITFEQGIVTHGVYTWGWIPGEDPASSETPLAGKEMIDPTWVEEATYSSGGSSTAQLISGNNTQVDATLPADTARATLPVYGFNKVFQSESGHLLELDDSKDLPRARYRHPKGTTILVDSDGSVHIRGGGAVWCEPKGDFVVGLTNGGTFKVIYDGGTALSVGPTGFNVQGHAATILGRPVEQIPDRI